MIKYNFIQTTKQADYLGKNKTFHVNIIYKWLYIDCQKRFYTD